MSASGSHWTSKEAAVSEYLWKKEKDLVEITQAFVALCENVRVNS